jgi:hypothetical protein
MNLRKEMGTVLANAIIIPETAAIMADIVYWNKK